MLSYSLGYSPDGNGHLPRSQVAIDLVGVAGFEPAASSSRTKRAAKLRHTPPTALGLRPGRADSPEPPAV
jgi:hypothetical protein